MKRTGELSSALAVVALLTGTAAAGGGPAYEIEELPHIGIFAVVMPRDLNDTGVAVGSDLDNALVSRAMRWENATPVQLDETPGRPSAATSIASNGLIAGWMQNPMGQTEAAIFDGKGVTFLGIPPGDFGGQAWGVNAGGVAVGFTTDETALDIAAMWANGKVVEIGGFDSIALDINDAGQIVGRHDTVDGRQALLWEGGKQTVLDDWNSGLASASAISDNGMIVGGALCPDDARIHAVAWLGETHVFTDLGLAGYLGTSAFGVNDATQIVGEGVISVEPPLSDALLWTDGVAVPLDDLIPPDSGWDLHRAVAINNGGQIIGTGTLNGAAGERAFLLTPIEAIVGDVDGDGDVDINDLLALLALWGPCPDPCSADFDGDGVVGITDLLALLANWS